MSDPVIHAPGGPPVAAAAARPAEEPAAERFPEHVSRNVFLSDASASVHWQMAREQPKQYEATVRDLVERRLYQSSFTAATKASILAVAIRGKLKGLEAFLLGEGDLVGVAEVLRALTILDAPRLSRQLRRKANRLEKSGARPGRLAALRTQAHNAERDALEGGSVTGAVARRVRRWLGSLPREKLGFYLINFPPEPWRRLLDLVHAAPRHFNLPEFQPVLYGGADKAPPGSVVAIASDVTAQNVSERLRRAPEQLSDCYSFLRRRLAADPDVAAGLRREELSRSLTALGFSRGQAYAALAANGAGGGRRRGAVNLDAAAEWIIAHPGREQAGLPDNPAALLQRQADRETVARLAPLEDVLWNYEELHCPAAEEAVRARLAAGEALDAVRGRSGYAKLMERILLFRERRLAFADLLLPVAEQRLADLVRANARPAGAYAPRVAVLGDASGSMGVAVRTSTVVASLLSVALRAADLLFFADAAWAPPVPGTVQAVLDVVESTRAEGGTCMASALLPLMRERRAVDLIVLVSDEGENGLSDAGETFAQLFARYRREVAPSCRVFLVSFLRVGEPGLVHERLQAEGIHARQYRLDPDRPDTSKFDALLGHVSMETSEADLRWREVREALDGVSDLASLVSAY